MKYPLFIAKRLNYSESTGSNSSILRFALSGLVLAVVIMFISIAIIEGFKSQISDTIFSIDSHIKLGGINDYSTGKMHTINYNDVYNATADLSYVKSTDPVIENYAILKTGDNFQSIKIKGIRNLPEKFERYIVDGNTDIFSDSTIYNVIISQTIANKLHLNIGDRVSAFFVDENVKMRNLTISAIYNCNFEDFDNVMVIGNIEMLRTLNRWGEDECSYVGIDMLNHDNLQSLAYDLYYDVYNKLMAVDNSTGFSIHNLYDDNISYFAWLDLLDSNILIVLILMGFVSAFTIVAAMLVIILDRIRTIAVLKSIGATDGAIRKSFNFLTQKLVIKGVVVGNIIGFAIALIQQKFQIVKLDPVSYYMSFVPVKFNIIGIVILDCMILIFAYVTLYIASTVVSKIRASETLRYE